MTTHRSARRPVTARVALAAALLACVPAANAQTPGVHYVEPAKPYGASPFLKTAHKAPVAPDGPLLVPLITWAADGVTVSANNGLEPDPNSPLARAVGRPVKLEVTDDFDKQVENYVSGKSPFLRGTADMIALVAQALKGIDPGLEPVVVMQLSTSTGADGFVAREGIASLADLKGKTVVTQINGPHLSLIGNLLKDAGLQPGDVTIRFVRDITAAPGYNPASPAEDPANAFRRDPQLTGAACISPDILALTAGGTVGTGLEGTVKGARPVFTTKTASQLIFDTYAVRRDFLGDHPEVVEAFRETHLHQQEFFLAELANIEKKRSADRARVESFKKLCRPLAKIFNQDENAVGDYIVWVGNDSQLAGRAGNARFFDDANPVGFRATTARIQEFFQKLGLIESVSSLAYNRPALAEKGVSEPAGPGAPPAPRPGVVPAFASTEAVRKAADSRDARVMYRYTFKFPVQVSDIKWQDYQDVFTRIHETVTRYGGAVVQLRGHADNFFYNFVVAKQKQGQTTYQRRVAGTDKFETLPLPKPEELLNDANALSYSRAFAIKRAYVAYVREALHLGPDEVDLSRFDVKGMGISDPVVKNPTTGDQRADNMRGEMVIIAAEAEMPAEIGADDLK